MSYHNSASRIKCYVTPSGDWDSHYPLFFRVAELSSVSPEALDQTAVFFYNNGESNRASDLFYQAVQREPTKWQYCLHYVQALFALKQYTVAAEILRDFLALSPNHVDARKHLANVLGEQGQHNEVCKSPHTCAFTAVYQGDEFEKLMVCNQSEDCLHVHTILFHQMDNSYNCGNDILFVFAWLRCSMF